MYEDNNDKFAKLRAIESGQVSVSTAPDVRNWSFEKDGNIMGTITGFDSFTHPSFGEQRTVIVRLESGEVISAFLNGYLQQGMDRQQAAVGNLVLIQFFGKPAGERFNRYHLVIQKDQPEMF
ncbi:hypothetical protein [Methylobacter svalbardensis]|uniref:hypothetical protein n=1 Tax=Methylobacter svalbardensis TaxID=3080016 RepID=UPI0030EE8072